MPIQNKEQVNKLVNLVDDDLKRAYEIIYNGAHYIERYRAERLYAELMLDWNRLYELLERENKTNENY